MDYELLHDFDRMRLWEKTTKNGNCLEWHGSKDRKDRKGYGQMKLGDRRGKLIAVHRIAWMLVNGPIPKGLVLDHTCHNRGCWNVRHLRPVTNKQNIENRAGANRNSKSGVRGVYWNRQHSKWHVQIGHNRKKYNGGLHVSLAEAEAAAIELRGKFFTHSDMDRLVS